HRAAIPATGRGGHAVLRDRGLRIPGGSKSDRSGPGHHGPGPAAHRRAGRLSRGAAAMSAWRRRRVEESSPAEDGHHGGAADAGAETEEVRDVTIPYLFADRASEPSLADQEWAESPRGGYPEEDDLT